MSFLSIKFYGAPIKSPVLNWNSKWQVLAISSGCFFGQDRLQSNDIGRIRIESNWTRILFKKMVTVVSFRHCCWLHSFWCWLMKTLSIFSFVSFFPFLGTPCPRRLGISYAEWCPSRSSERKKFGGGGLAATRTDWHQSPRPLYSGVASNENEQHQPAEKEEKNK